RRMSMKLAVSSLIVCTVLAFGFSASFAADPGKSGGAAKKEDARAKAFNVKCPVEREDVDPEVPTTTYKGKVIGFCCESCIKDFNKDPEKYMKVIAADNKKAEEDAKKAGKGKGKTDGKTADKSDSQAAGKAEKPVNKF